MMDGENRRTEVWTDGRMDGSGEEGRKNGEMDRWMDKGMKMDGQIDRCYRRTDCRACVHA